MNGFLLCEPNLRKSTFDPNHCYATDVIAQMEVMISNKKLSVDEHHSDQLMAFMALAKGTSRIRTIKPLSLHCQTLVQLLPMFNKGINIKCTDEEETVLIEIQGIGLEME